MRVSADFILFIGNIVPVSSGRTPMRAATRIYLLKSSYTRVAARSFEEQLLITSELKPCLVR
jgi:hypothetical protein